MNITLKQLRVFYAITQSRTLTEAAESLFLSKAALSLSLTELEKQLGHPLFDRVNHRLLLNQAGQALLPLADEMLNRANQLETLFSGEQPLTGQLRIGASDTIGNQIAPFLLRDFRAQHGHLEQSLFISNSALIGQKLLDFELDIALIEGNPQHDAFDALPFHGDHMCVIAAPNHALCHRSTLSVADLTQQAWLLREPGSGTREFFLQHIAPQLSNWQEAFELNTTEALLNSVSAGLGLACLSRLAATPAESAGRVRVLPVNTPMPRQFWLLIHKDKYRHSLLRCFIEFCQIWHPDTQYSGADAKTAY